jgi:hypothetical protein
VGTFPRPGSRCVERVGPSVSKITRARNEKGPGTSGGRENQARRAVVETPSGEIRLGAVFERGSAHEPLPENPESEREVIGILESPGVTCLASTPLNRPLDERRRAGPGSVRAAVVAGEAVGP